MVANKPNIQKIKVLYEFFSFIFESLTTGGDKLNEHSSSKNMASKE